MLMKQLLLTSLSLMKNNNDNNNKCSCFVITIIHIKKMFNLKLFIWLLKKKKIENMKKKMRKRTFVVELYFSDYYVLKLVKSERKESSGAIESKIVLNDWNKKIRKRIMIKQIKTSYLTRSSLCGDSENHMNKNTEC